MKALRIAGIAIAVLLVIIAAGVAFVMAKFDANFIKTELAKLQAEHEVLAKSHRRLVAKVLDDRTATEQFLGQMAVDRMMVYPR